MLTQLSLLLKIPWRSRGRCATEQSSWAFSRSTKPSAACRRLCDLNAWASSKFRILDVWDWCLPVKAQDSLNDLIKYEPKPNGDVRWQFALAVTGCIQCTWELDQRQLYSRCYLSGRNARFLTSYYQLHSLEIPFSTPFLSGFAAPLVSQAHPDLEWLLLNSFMSNREDSFRPGSIKNINASIYQTLGGIFLEISNWRSCRDFLSLEADSSV